MSSVLNEHNGQCAYRLTLMYSSAGSAALITNGSEDSSMQELQR